MRDGTPSMFYMAVKSLILSLSLCQASKLARIAQAKSKQGGLGVSKLNTTSLPSPSTLVGTLHTEYMTPIANGPTTMTAILMSYQTLCYVQTSCITLALMLV